MALDQCFGQEWKSISSTASTTESDNESGCFDCNICLHIARDPVVTLCGHLYCWPCIYKWFHFQSAVSLSSDDHHPQCPVCKSNISDTTLVPLYVHGGQNPNECGLEGKTASIPPRPPACGTQALFVQQMPYRNAHQGQQYFPHSYDRYEEEYSPQSLSLTGNSRSAETGVSHPGIFGEMVYARVFGNSESLYAYPNSYHLSSPRLRRQEMQADISLNRVSIFLFCCFLLCLLLF